VTKDDRIYLIDGSAYIHRAYHAIRSLSTSHGFATNAAYGFSRMLIKLINDRAPKYAAMVFDSKGPTFRHGMFAEYKANRSAMPDDLAAQIPYIKKITEGFNLPVIEAVGYEADDLIGTLAKKAEDAGFEVVMVTGDKDFIQLITDRVTLWDPMKDEVLDRAAVMAKFCIEPHQMLDIQGLSGDTSDNIPGVPGIGPKTAIKLIQAFGSMDGLYARLGEITAAKQLERLETYKAQALLSRELARIDIDAPVDFDPDALRMATPDNNRLAMLFKELEFRQLQKEFPVESDLSDKTYRCITDPEALDDLIQQLKTAGRFAIDTETTSLSPMAAELVGVSVSIEPETAFYIPCGHTCADARQLDMAFVLDRLKPVLEDAGIEKIGQNIKYDWTVLRRYGIDLAGVAFDTMLASYLLNPEKRAHGLDQIALDLLDHRMIPYDEVIVVDGKKCCSFAEIPVDPAAVYSCEDADITLAASRKLAPMLADLRLTELFETVEMPLVPVLVRMEETGIRVDTEQLAAMSVDLADELAQIETGICELAGETFNINSSQQLGRILFEKLCLPHQKKTKKKTGYSTDVEVLTALALHHDLPAQVLRHRMLSKLKSTYVDALIELAHPETGRIHTSFNQTVTATGRLSSSNPNLQNIPIRTETGRDVRRAFIPRDGWYFLAADYSQIELRLLAHYSGDEKLIRSFLNDEDIHTRTAAEVFMADPAMVTAELRRQAKAINFGIIYGMGAYSLSKDLGISQKMAKTYIDNYFYRYSGVRTFIDQTLETARATGKICTELGRIRYLPDINSSNRNMRAFAERTAMNMPIQGTAADLIKLAMIRVDKALSENRLQTAMLLSVHDELVFEAPPEELETVKSLVCRIMENVWDLKVPLKVNMAAGKNWAEAH